VIDAKGTVGGLPQLFDVTRSFPQQGGKDFLLLRQPPAFVGKRHQAFSSMACLTSSTDAGET
jgi:hypothetical protein